MDDLTFRRKLFTDPNDNSEEVQQALEQSEQNRRLRTDMMKFERTLQDSLKVPVPQGLAQRIIAQQQLKQPTPRKTHWYWLTAASVTLTITAMLFNLGWFNRYERLDQYALAHTYAELSHANQQTAINNQRVEQLLAQLNVQFEGLTEQIGFADFCYFGGLKALHLVFKGEHSAVTVYVVPKQHNLERSSAFSDGHFNGTLLSQLSTNDVLLITDKNESLAGWQKKIEAMLLDS